jgi:bacillolysin
MTNLRSLALLFPLFLFACAADDIDDAPTQARDFVLAHPARFGSAVGAAELVVQDSTRDELGMTRVRFQLRVAGLPLDGGDVVAVLDGTGVRSIHGGFPARATLSTPAVLDAAAAEARARAAFAAELPGLAMTAEAPSLVAMDVEGALRPAWRVEVTGAADDDYAARELMVDASSGAILRERDLVETVAAVGSGVGFAGHRRTLQIERRTDGSYALHDLTRGHGGIRTYSAGGNQALPGKPVTSLSATSWDNAGEAAGAAVDAHAFAAMTYDYLASVHHRKSIDGADGAIQVVVHWGHAVMNAFWDGHRAVFGDGEGEGPLAAGLDVVAHEIFHGVTQATSGLVYAGESGALNESLSDVFGTFVELHAGSGNWTIGESVTHTPLRDLARPTRSGLPCHMSQYVHLPSDPMHDMGGVHTNSTIPSHAAYLVAVGGTNEVSHAHVSGIGVTKTRAIWYRAATTYLSSHASFADFAAATHSAAQDLYGAGSTAVTSVDAAWHAVGVE